MATMPLISPQASLLHGLETNSHYLVSISWLRISLAGIRLSYGEQRVDAKESSWFRRLDGAWCTAYGSYYYNFEVQFDDGQRVRLRSGFDTHVHLLNEPFDRPIVLVHEMFVFEKPMDNAGGIESGAITGVTSGMPSAGTSIRKTECMQVLPSKKCRRINYSGSIAPVLILGLRQINWIARS